jgi:hypothetical protein
MVTQAGIDQCYGSAGPTCLTIGCPLAARCQVTQDRRSGLNEFIRELDPAGQDIYVRQLDDPKAGE